MKKDSRPRSELSLVETLNKHKVFMQEIIVKNTISGTFGGTGEEELSVRKL